MERPFLGGAGTELQPPVPGLKQPPAFLWGSHAHPSLQRTIGQILASTEAFSRFETILEVSLGGKALARLIFCAGTPHC